MDAREVFCFEPHLRKHLSHLQRLRSHLSALDPPPLPDRDSDANAVALCEAFVVFVRSLPEEWSRDAEVQQFLASSVPDREAWQAGSAPKVRRAVVDVEVLCAFELPLPAGMPCYAVVSAGEQRYATRLAPVATGEAHWNEEATLSVASSAAWVCVHVFAMSGTWGGAVLVGCSQFPVFAMVSSGETVNLECELRDVRIAPALPVAGRIRLRASASHVASRTHLAQSRGHVVRGLPIRLHTGDVVFFKMSRVTSFLNRLVTWSDYDHVGVVVASSKKLRLLESVSDKGVTVLDLEDALTLYKSSSSEIAVMRLRFERTEEVLQNAARYAQEVRGLAYNWSVVDMVTTSTQERQDSKAMFCSQLVAATLKQLGVLPSTVVADNYLPGTLSSPNLALQKHVERDPLVRFSHWGVGGDERQYVALRPPFEPCEAVLNARWKQAKAGDRVMIVGTTEDGFLLCADGTQVPSAFVD